MCVLRILPLRTFCVRAHEEKESDATNFALCLLPPFEIFPFNVCEGASRNESNCEQRSLM